MPHMQTSDITDWTPDELTDLSGKLFLITGGNSGIGFEAARLLAERNADVVIAARNEMKGKKALAKLVNLGEGSCELLSLDLADSRDLLRRLQPIGAAQARELFMEACART